MTNLADQTNIMQRELDRARSLALRSLMKVAHREYAPAVAELREAIETDPDLISRFCVFLARGGTAIRDQIDVALITLLQAAVEFPEYREAGRLLLFGSDVYDIAEPYGDLSGLPPFRVFRIAQFVDQSDRKVARLLKSSMRDYIHMFEQDVQRFDSVALLNRSNLRWAYKRFHIKPNDRAQAILFDNNPPSDSKFAAIKQIVAEEDVAEKAKLIVEAKIPYRIASTLIPKMNAAAGVALVAAMSPTEALNSRQWIESSGLLNIEEVKSLYLGKVAKATKSIASADHRASAQGSDTEVEAAVQSAKQSATEREQRIASNLLLLVDISGSMNLAIDIAMKFGARIAPLCDGDLMVIAHNTEGRIIEVPSDQRDQLSVWEQAFKGIRAGGGTNHQRGLIRALEVGFMPQSVVLITDGGENGGDFTLNLSNFAANTSFEPHVVMIHLDGQANVLGPKLEASSLRYDEFNFDGDYYLFDQVGAILGGPAAKSLVQRVLDTELPRRIQ